MITILNISFDFTFIPLFVVVAIAWLVPMFMSIFKLQRIPTVIVEIIAGFLIGHFIIDFARGKPVDYCSSNTIYNLKYSKILGLYSQKCERIEDIFKGVRNSIKLNEDKKNAKQENT